MNNFNSVNSFSGKNPPPPPPLDKGQLLKHPFPARQFKSLLLTLVLSAVFVPLLISCPDAGSPTTYTVTFNSGKGSDVPSQSVKSGEQAARPANPVQPEYHLENWYSDAAFQTVYDFNQPVEGDITLYAAWHHELKSVIDSGTVPSDLSTYGALVRSVLEPYTAGAAITAEYVDTTSQGSGDASSWTNAAGDIKATLDAIADAEANKIYLVLLASGTHTPPDTLAMKNHVAIVGGWDEWEQSGTSTISGEDTRNAFENSNKDHTALLYGVTIVDGYADLLEEGGGMWNKYSSPTLINVTFADNEAATFGGGMYNYYSEPTLINVAFVNNKAIAGGGMNNSYSSPTLINVTFVGNTALSISGGMQSNYSSPTLINVTFVNNKANGDGGGMYVNANGESSGPTLVNTLFWNNTGDIAASNGTTTGQQIYINNTDGGGAENMTISFSLVQHGIGVTTNATSDNDPADGLSIDGGSDPVTITQAHNISDNPALAADPADNGGLVQTMALLANSPAANAGVYVQRSGTPGSYTFYYSEDDTNWFADAALSTAITGAIPADAIYLTAADARGYIRSDRPDIGAYEYGGTAP